MKTCRFFEPLSLFIHDEGLQGLLFRHEGPHGQKVENAIKRFPFDQATTLARATIKAKW